MSVQHLGAVLAHVDDECLDDHGGVAAAHQLGPGLDLWTHGRPDQLEGEVGGGHPVRPQDPYPQETAHHVHQRGQDPDPCPPVGPGDERAHPGAGHGTGVGEHLGPESEITEEVAGWRVAPDGHSAFLFGGTDQHFVDGHAAGTGHREDDRLGDVLGLHELGLAEGGADGLQDLGPVVAGQLGPAWRRARSG